MRSPMSEALQARATLAARAGYLAENTPYGAAIVRAWEDNLISRRAKPAAPRHEDPGGLERVVVGGRRRRPDRSRRPARRAARSLVTAGEAFLIEQVDDDGLKLRLINPEQVDGTKNFLLTDGARIVSGIELDGAGRRLAYWILPVAPDNPLGGAEPVSQRVEAASVHHIFDPPHPGSVRGRSWLSAAATRAVEVDGLEDALLVKAKVAALFCAFISGTGEADFAPTAENGGKPALSMEPGAVRVLPADTSITFPNPPPLDGASDFLRSQVRSLAAASGVPYELIGADMSQTNFSSARLGLGEFPRQGRRDPEDFAERRPSPAFSVASSRSRSCGQRLAADIDALDEPVFLWPGWAAIDPEGETKADILSVAAGFRSRSEIIAARGRDPDEVAAEIRDDPAGLPPMKLNVIVGGFGSAGAGGDGVQSNANVA